MSPMGEKRRHRRIRRKLKIVFTHDEQLKAFTTDLSTSGVAIASDFVALPGAEVRGELMMPEGKRATFRAVVRWARKAKGRAILVGTNAMGLEFVAPPGPAYHAFLLAILAKFAQAAPAAAKRAPKTERAAPGLTHARGRAAPGSTAAVTPAERSAAGATASGGPVIVWPVSPVGHVARLSAKVEASDLATPSNHPAGLSLNQVVRWMEEATRRCLDPLMPAEMSSAVVGTSITITHRPPVEIGSTVTTVASITRLTARGRTVSFDVRISEGKRELADGKVARILIDERPGGA